MFNQQRFLAAFQVVQQCQSTRFNCSLNQLHVFASVPSTNQTAWELFDQNLAVEPVVIAQSQTAGRGQWGRQWMSEPGGLYLSAGFNLSLPVEQSAQLTLGTAWGIAIALRTIPGLLSGVATVIPVQIKWLNDLVLHGYKLGGILSETRVQQGQITKAVIGVGINWSNSVPEVGVNLKSFLATQPVPLIESLEMLAAITLHGLHFGISHWQQHGINRILLEYLELLAHRNHQIWLNEQPGTIVGIAPSGELRVQMLAAAGPQPAIQPVPMAEILVKPGTINLDYPLKANGSRRNF